MQRRHYKIDIYYKNLFLYRAMLSPWTLILPTSSFLNKLIKMKKPKISLCHFFVVVTLFMLFSCNSSQQEKPKDVADTAAVKQEMPKPVKETVITAEQQKALTPDAVLQGLKDGNARFVNNNVTARDHSRLVREASFGQFPKAVILSCVDSRIPVEDVFDKGIGDIFVARVAGNIVNDDIIGSMEFGCKVSGAKLILVLGHGNCGAVKAAIDNVKLGNITMLLNKIRPAVMKSQNFAGDKSSKNAEFIDAVGKNNVLNSIELIKSKSPILKEMLDKGEIKIAGAYYNMKTGEVTFIE
jgi:carbonic anhydrase